MAKEKQEITQEEIAAIIEEMAKRWPHQKDLARQLEISNGYLSDILSRIRPVSDRVARKLGYRRIVKYTREGDIERQGTK